MTDAQVLRAKAALDAGASLAEVAADYDVDRSTLYRRVEQLRLEEQELRCRDCQALIDSPSVACGNCDQDDPAPAARAALEDVLAEQPPAVQPDDHGDRFGPARYRTGFTRWSGGLSGARPPPIPCASCKIGS